MIKINSDEIKLIFSDVDGTLITKNHIIPAGNLKGIQAALESDSELLFGICSGRMPLGCVDLLTQINIPLQTRFLIGANGAAIYDLHNKNYIFKSQFSTTTTAAIHRIAYQYGAYFETVSCDDDETIYCSSYDGAKNIKEARFNLKNFDGTKYTKYLPDSEYQIQATKVVVFFENSSYREQFVEALQSELGIQAKQFHDCGCDVVPDQDNKWTGILKTIEFLNQKNPEANLRATNILFFGDEMNDLHVFESAPYPIAMGNAHPTIKQLSYAICDTNENGGLGQFLIENLH